MSMWNKIVNNLIIIHIQALPSFKVTFRSDHAFAKLTTKEESYILKPKISPLIRPNIVNSINNFPNQIKWSICTKKKKKGRRELCKSPINMEHISTSWSIETPHSCVIYVNLCPSLKLLKTNLIVGAVL